MTTRTDYRQNFTPERASSGAFLAGLVAFVYLVALPALVYWRHLPA